MITACEVLLVVVGFLSRSNTALSITESGSVSRWAEEYEDEWYQLPPLHHTSGLHRYPADYEYPTTPAPTYLPPDLGYSPCPSCPELPCCPPWPHRRYWIRSPPPQDGLFPCPLCNTGFRCVICPTTTTSTETETPDPVPDTSCTAGAPPLFAIRSNITRSLASFANNVIGAVCQSDGDDGLRSLVPIIQGACDRRRDSSTCLTNYTYIEELVKKIVDCTDGARASSSKVLFDMDPDVLSVVSRMTDEVLGRRDDDHRIYLLGKLKWELDRERIWERGAAIVLNTLPGLNRYKLTDLIATESQLFFGPDVWASARNAAANDNQSCFVLDEKDGWEVNGVENHLFYFREDIGVNSHHTYWHALHGYQRSHPACHVYEGGTTGCHEDRRGELFYYMHRVMLARYDTERLIAGMEPLEKFRFKKNGLIDTVYAPPWRNQNSSDTVDRCQSILNVTCLPEYILGRDKCKVEATNVATLIEQIDLLEKAIADGTYIDNGEMKALNIDLLGDFVEASNKHAKHPWGKKFGSIHNQGHDIISRVGNPSNVNEVNRGVMGDTITAMRDPIFYRWHLMIDHLLDGHKRKLPPYKINEPDWCFPIDVSKYGSKYKFNFAPKTDEVDGGCKLAPIMCGMPGVGTKYPDLGLPMGYPFDRFPSPEHRGWTVEQFAKGIPKMWVTEVTITHKDMPWFEYFEGISETDYVAGRLKAINLTNYSNSIMDSREAAYRRLKQGGWDSRLKPNPPSIGMTCDYGNTDLSKDTDVTRQPVPISSTPPTNNLYTSSPSYSNQCCYNYFRYGRDAWCCYG